jgi:hypothetical protein
LQSLAWRQFIAVNARAFNFSDCREFHGFIVSQFALLALRGKLQSIFPVQALFARPASIPAFTTLIICNA